MIIFFDTETTGLPKNWKAPLTDSDNWPRMVQIAWQIYTKDGERVSSSNYLIRPSGFMIPDAAFKVHGISTEKAWNEGRELEQVLVEFDRISDDASYLVGHNVAFDLKVVGAEMARLNLSSAKMFGIKSMCTMQLGASVCQIPTQYGGYKQPSLAELHQCLFNTGFDGAHDALADVEACARCFFALKDKGMIVP
ncbi:3'-5' exonuclease [Candidatus Falkowbacteria bacterium]|nr:3'-5' exonuclease [Candidatus Falkowbacteria bacterium]